MAKLSNRIPITVDVNIDKQKLKQAQDNINSLFKFKSGGTSDYAADIQRVVNTVIKEANKIYSGFNKPLMDRTVLRETSKQFDKLFGDIDNKLLSIQGNLQKTYSSKENSKFLNQFREISLILGELTQVSDRVSGLNAINRKLGNKSELKSLYSSQNKEYNSLKSKNSPTAEEIKEMNTLKASMKEINAILERKHQLEQESNELLSQVGARSQREVNELIERYANDQSIAAFQMISIEDFENFKTTLGAIRDLIRDISKTSDVSSNNMEYNIKKVDEEMKQAEQNAITFKNIWRELGLPALSLAGLANGIRQVINYSYDYLKNLDAALTEISVVSGKTRKEVLSLTDTFIELSAQTGMAIDDIAQASTIFYQQGLGDEAVKEMTRYTAMFAKISGETVETASDQLTAAINGFNLSYDNAEKVVDKLSVLAAYSAADIDELATAMSKGASAASQAGLSFDQYNAYLATMIETTREAPENIGTSLKTIMARFQQIKTDENTEDDTTVNDVEKALKTVGIQLRDTSGELRDLGDVLDELGPKWSALDRNTQAYLGTVIAGTRQQSRFISLMQNWDRALELTAASEASAGAATEMHSSAMQGLDAALTKLQNTWQKLISKITGSEFIKVLVNIANFLLNLISHGNVLLNIISIIWAVWEIRHNLLLASLERQGKEVQTLDSVWAKLQVRLKNLAADYRALASAANQATAAIATNNGVSNVSAGETSTTGTGESSSVKGLFGLNKEGLEGGFSKIMMAVAIASMIRSIGEVLIDLFTTTTEEAQEKYDEVKEERAKKLKEVQTLETNIETYEKLNKKVSKTTEEIEQMGEAANAIAEISADSIIGYDQYGNKIIDTNTARATQEEKQQEALEQTGDQLEAIADLGYAELRDKKLEDRKNNNIDKYAWTGGGIAAGATIGASIGSAATPIGTAIGGIIGGAIGLIGSEIVDNIQASIDAQKEAAKEAYELWKTMGAEIIEALNSTTKALVDEDDVEVASIIATGFAAGKVEKAVDSNIKNGKLDVDQYKKDIEAIATEWEVFLKQLPEDALSSAENRLNLLKDNYETEKYSEVEKEMNAILSGLGMGENSELYESIKDTVYRAVFNGATTSFADVADFIKNNPEYNDLVNSMTGEEVGLLSNVGLFDDVNVFKDFLYNYQNYVEEGLAESTDEATIRCINSLEELKTKYEELGQDTSSITKMIANAWDSLAYSADISWGELWDILDEITDKTYTLGEALSDLNDGRMSFDNWKEFTTLLDEMDTSMLSAEQLNSMASAIDLISSGLSVVNGEIVANQEAVRTAAEIENMYAQATLQTTKNQLISKQEELEAKKAIIKAQIATLEAKIAEAEGSVEADSLKSEADAAWLDASNEISSKFLNNEALVVEKMVGLYIEGFNEILTARNKFASGESSTVPKFSDITNLSFESYTKTLEKNGVKTAEQLKKVRDAMKKALAETEYGISSIKLKLATLNSGITDMTSGMTKSASETKDSLDTVLGTLEEIYNVIRQIETLTNRLDILKQLSEISIGDLAGTYAMEQISVAKSIYDKNVQKLGQQQYREKYEQELIKNSPVGDIFSFDENNDIMINWKKYAQLTGEELELADDLYDEYVDLHKETNTYYSDCISSLSEYLQYQQELVDLYNDTLHEMASITKDIYKKMLDNKLEAIDTEIEALDKLKEAYEDANKAASDSKEISNLQTSLKRSVMDTSGASNSKVLDYRDQIRSKLDDMGQDAYTKRMDDIKQILEDQKEGLRDAFDEFFEDWTQLYKLIEEGILGDFESVKALIMTTEDYKQATEAERKELLSSWETKMSVIKTAFEENGDITSIGKNVVNMLDSINNTKSMLSQIDSTLKSGSLATAIGTSLSSVLKDYLLSQSSDSSDSSGSNSSGGSTNKTKTTSSTSTPTSTPTPTPEVYTITLDNGYGSSQSKKITAGNSITLPTMSRSGYTFRGWSIPSLGMTTMGSYAYKPTRSETVTATWTKNTVSSLVSTLPTIGTKPANFSTNTLPTIGGKKVIKNANGGMISSTGLAWLDGTKANPEAVLNAAQTKAFLSLTSNLAKIDTYGTGLGGNSVVIDNIKFEVESMSSVEDGEKAFDAFVNKFKEVGSQSGLSFTNAKI